MGSEFERSGWEPSGAKISISNSQFVDYVISKAADEAEARSQRRESVRGKSARWIATLLGLLAIAGLATNAYLGFRAAEVPRQNSDAAMAVVNGSAIASANDAAVDVAVVKAMQSPSMQDKINLAVERKVKEASDAKIAALSSRLDGILSYQQLSALTMQLEVNDSFSDDDREQVLAVLSELKAHDGFVELPGFRRNLKKIVDSFTSAYQVAAVDQLDDLFRTVLIRIKDVPRWMTNHFGRALLTSSDINEKDSKRWERLRFYSDATKQNRNPEISHLWELLAAFVISYERKSPEVDALVSQIGHLAEKDREIFLRALLEEGTASEREPPDMRRLAEIVGKFIAAYQAELVSYGLEIE